MTDYLKRTVSLITILVMLSGITISASAESVLEIENRDSACEELSELENIQNSVSEEAEPEEKTGYSPAEYIPYTADEWKAVLTKSLMEKAQKGCGGYSSSASLISSCAKDLGLVSVNIFADTDSADEMYYAVINDVSTNGYRVHDITSNHDKFSGSVIFFKETKSEGFSDCGYIINMNSDAVTYIYADSNGNAVIEESELSKLSDETEIIRIEYKNCEELVWEALTDVFSYYNEAVLCGIMSNIYAESSFNPAAVGDSGRSYGLCQWFMDRNDALKDFALINGWDAESILTQIRFLKYELDTRAETAGLSDILIAVDNDEYGANYAGYIFCIEYENPDDTINKAKYRGTLAQLMYRYYHEDGGETSVRYMEDAPEINTLILDNYRRNSGQYDVRLTIAQSVDAVYIDKDMLKDGSYSISGVSGEIISITNETMSSLPSGWHDIYIMSDKLISTGSFLVDQEDMSVAMASVTFSADTTSIVFTDAAAPRSAEDISRAQDYGVVMWYEGTACYISTQRAGIKIKAPEDSSFLFGSNSGDGMLKILTSVDVSMLDVSSVAQMTGMFKGAGYNVQDFCIVGMDNWDTGNVTDMSEMFYETGYSATSWSIGDLRWWDVGNVEDMHSMFAKAGYNAFLWCAGDLSSWNTGKVISMASMFECAGYNSVQFILDLRWWNVENVLTMGSMFRNAGYYTDYFSLSVGVWDISAVTNMSSMFENAGYCAADWSIGDLRTWDVSHVESMGSMFKGSGHEASFFCLNFSGWDTSSVCDMSSMFEDAGSGASVFELAGVEGWNTSCVKNMNCMFRYSGCNATNFGLNLSSWDVSSVETMSGMFSNAGFNVSCFRLELNGWDTGNVKELNEMFRNAGARAKSFALTGLKYWNVENVETTEAMFYGCAHDCECIELDLSGWQLEHLTNMNSMFMDMGSAAAIFTLNLDGWGEMDASQLNTFTNTGTTAKFVPPEWYVCR